MIGWVEEVSEGLLRVVRGNVIWCMLECVINCTTGCVDV